MASDSGTTALESPSSSSPDAAGRHRVSGAIGYAATNVHSSIESDFSYNAHAGSVRAAYAYRAVNGLEVGADVSYWISDDSSINTLIPCVTVRPYLPLGRSVELGLTFRAGLIIWSQSSYGGTGAWTGSGMSAGPDVRIWLDRTIGVELAADGTVASGKGPARLNVVSDNASFIAAGLFASAVVRL
jgi:hypothetical protein